MKKFNFSQSPQLHNKVNGNPKESQSKLRKIWYIGRRVGNLLGANNFLNSVSLVRQTFNGSVPRITALWNRISDKPTRSTIPSGIQSNSDRFLASMKHHRIDATMLETMIATTKRNFDLYVCILICSIILGCVSLITFPPNNLLNGMIRFLVVPFLGALVFKHAYSNWIFRNRVLATPSTFLRANDKWPRLKSLTEQGGEKIINNYFTGF